MIQYTLITGILNFCFFKLKTIIYQQYKIIDSDKIN